MEQDAIGPGLGLEHDLAALGDQHAGLRPPLPVFMSWANTRIWSREVLTIASRSLVSTRVVACRCFWSVTLTT